MSYMNLGYFLFYEGGKDLMFNDVDIGVLLLSLILRNFNNI